VTTAFDLFLFHRSFYPIICPLGSSCGPMSSSPIPFGRYSFTGEDECNDCQVGTYNNDIGQSTCQQCRSGYYCGTAATHETICSAGKVGTRKLLSLFAYSNQFKRLFFVGWWLQPIVLSAIIQYWY
jgi:hypothetical protein